MTDFETRVFRDPVHGYIRVEDPLIWDLINAPEFQRLRRIHQLGGVFQVYHSAEHSRFTHCLGVYEIARRISSEVKSVQNALSPYDRRVLLCAALLHDIGHGPYSHLFEKISHISHETFSARLITDPASSIARILIRHGGSRMPQDVASVLDHGYSNPAVNALISSQLDCDRMDYLLRDAYSCAVTYGNFDLERILRVIRFENGQLCVKASGIHAVEDYSMARYQMYWQVYLHPDATGFEQLILQFFRRLKCLETSAVHDWFAPLLEETMSLEQFVIMDESWLNTGFRLAMSDDDEILSDYANRILNRRLPGWVDVCSMDQIERLKNLCEMAGYDPEWYCLVYQNLEREYLPYQEKDGNAILVLGQDHRIVPLSEKSSVAKALLQVRSRPQLRCYLPKDLVFQAEQALFSFENEI